MQLTLLPTPFQNYSIQPACEIWGCGTQGDNSVWAASWSTLHEQWGKKVDRWCGDNCIPFFSHPNRISWLVSLISLCFCFLEPFFLIPITLGFLFCFALFCFYYMGDCIAIFISRSFSAGSSNTPWWNRLWYQGQGWLILSALHFVGYLFFSSTVLTWSRGFIRD